MNGNRFGSLLLGSFVLSGLAGANTGTPWGNPLLKGVPQSAVGFVSVDLSGSQQPLKSVLNIVQAAGQGAGGLNALLKSGLDLLKLPDDVSQACLQSGTHQIAIFAELPRAGIPSVGVIYGLKPGHHLKDALTLDGGVPGVEHGIPYQKVEDKFVAVTGNTLVITDSAAETAKAVHALKGGPSFDRKRLAKLGTTVEPDAEIIGAIKGDTSSVGFGAIKGLPLEFAASIGLHKGGVSVCVGPVKMPSMPGVPSMATFGPLPKNYLWTLPGGPYFITCLAPLGPVLTANKAMREVLGNHATEKRFMRSALNGDLILGLYPTTMKGGKPDGMDLLAEVRPRSGGNPGLNFIGALKGQMGEMMPGMKLSLFQSFSVKGADHAYRLNPKVLSLAKMALKGMAKESKLPLDSLVKPKTLEIAMVGRSVIVATSDPVLRKAVAAYKFNKSALINDPKFKELAVDANKPTQLVFAVAISRIVQFGTGLFQNVMASGGLGKAGLPEGLPIGMIAGMLGQWPDPLLLRLSSTQDGLSARIFLPIDFNTLSMLAGSFGKGNR